MNNRQQKRQFEEAIRQIETVLRRNLSKDERRRLHDEITRGGLKTIKEIVDWGFSVVSGMSMKLKKEIQDLFRPLIGQTAWGAKVGWGSFVTIEFGTRRLQHHHYHGDWHLWLYQCDWILKSETHEMANSESKKGLMQTAIDNLDNRELLETFFDQQHMVTEFLFEGNLRLRCQPYKDAKPTEEYWMLFTPEKQVASLVADGLRFEPVPAAKEEKALSPR